MPKLLFAQVPQIRFHIRVLKLYYFKQYFFKRRP